MMAAALHVQDEYVKVDAQGEIVSHARDDDKSAIKRDKDSTFISRADSVDAVDVIGEGEGTSNIYGVIRKHLYNRCASRCEQLCYESSTDTVIPKRLLIALHTFSTCMCSSESYPAETIDELLIWRREAHEKSSTISTSTRYRKAQVVDRTFCEVMTFLLKSSSRPNIVPTQASSLEAIAFHLLLQSQGNNDQTEPQDSGLVPYEWARIAGILSAAKLLGIFAALPSRFEAVTRRFIAELSLRLSAESNASSSSSLLVRNDLLTFIRCVSHINLTGAFTYALASLTAFIMDAFPLRFTAQKKKSEVHHALCTALTRMLNPLLMMTTSKADALSQLLPDDSDGESRIESSQTKKYQEGNFSSSENKIKGFLDSNLTNVESNSTNPSPELSSLVGLGGIVPLPSRTDVSTTTYWHHSVHKLRSELGSWLKSDGKHSSSGYPLFAVLLCLSHGDEFGKHWNSFTALLRKMFKDRRLSAVAFDCLCHLVHTYTCRHYHYHRLNSIKNALPSSEAVRSNLSASIPDILVDMILYIKSLDNKEASSTTALDLSGKRAHLEKFVSICLVLSLVDLEMLLVKVVAPLLTFNDNSPTSVFSDSIHCGIEILYRVLMQLGKQDANSTSDPEACSVNIHLKRNINAKTFDDDVHIDEIDERRYGPKDFCKGDERISLEAGHTVISMLPSISHLLHSIGMHCHQLHGRDLNFTLKTTDSQSNVDAHSKNNDIDTEVESNSRYMIETTTSFAILLQLLKIAPIFVPETASSILSASSQESTSPVKVLLSDFIPSYMTSRYMVLRRSSRECLLSLIKYQEKHRISIALDCCRFLHTVCCDATASIENIQDIADFIILLLEKIRSYIACRRGISILESENNKDSLQEHFTVDQLIVVESLGFLLLCHYDVSIRIKGLSFLKFCHNYYETYAFSPNDLNANLDFLPFMVHLEAAERYTNKIADAESFVACRPQELEPIYNSSHSNQSYMTLAELISYSYGNHVYEEKGQNSPVYYYWRYTGNGDAMRNIEMWSNCLSSATRFASSLDRSKSFVEKEFESNVLKVYMTFTSTLENFVDSNIGGYGASTNEENIKINIKYIEDVSNVWTNIGSVIFSHGKNIDALKKTIHLGRKAAATLFTDGSLNQQIKVECKRVQEIVLFSITHILSNVHEDLLQAVFDDLQSFINESVSPSILTIRSDYNFRIKSKTKNQQNQQQLLLLSHVQENIHHFVAVTVLKACHRCMTHADDRRTFHLHSYLTKFMEDTLKFIELKEDKYINDEIQHRLRYILCFVVSFSERSCLKDSSNISSSFRSHLFARIMKWRGDKDTTGYDSALSLLLCNTTNEGEGHLIRIDGPAVTWLKEKFREKCTDEKKKPYRNALKHLLRIPTQSSDFMDMCVSECFNNHDFSIASEFFIVIVEHYSEQVNKNVETGHRPYQFQQQSILIVLSLFFSGNTSVPESRQSALNLLDAILTKIDESRLSSIVESTISWRMTFSCLGLSCSPSTIRKQQLLLSQEVATFLKQRNIKVIFEVCLQFLECLGKFSVKNTQEHILPESATAILVNGLLSFIQYLDLSDLSDLSDLKISKNQSQIKTRQNHQDEILQILFDLTKTCHDHDTGKERKKLSLHTRHTHEIWYTICRHNERNIRATVEWILRNVAARISIGTDMVDVINNIGTVAEVLVCLSRKNVNEILQMLVSEVTLYKSQRSQFFDSRILLSLASLAALMHEYDEEMRLHLPMLLHVSVVILWNNDDNNLQNYKSRKFVPKCLFGVYARKLLSALASQLVYRQLALSGCKNPKLQYHDSTASDLHKPEILVEIKDFFLLITELEKEQTAWLETLFRLPSSNSSFSLMKINLKNSYCRYQGLVVTLVKCLEFTEGLINKLWCEEAIDWSMSCKNDNNIIQSMRVLRELKPSLSSCGKSMYKILESFCIYSEDTELDPDKESLYTEVIMTLQLIIETISSQEIMLHPEVFWICMKLLSTSTGSVFNASSSMFCSFIDRMDFGSDSISLLLLAVPLSTYDVVDRQDRKSRERETIFERDILNPILYRLTDKSTLRAATDALLSITSRPNGTIFGDPRKIILKTISNLLPWLANELDQTDQSNISSASPNKSRNRASAMHISDELLKACEEFGLPTIAEEFSNVLATETLVINEMVRVLVTAICDLDEVHTMSSRTEDLQNFSNATTECDGNGQQEEDSHIGFRDQLLINMIFPAFVSLRKEDSDVSSKRVALLILYSTISFCPVHFNVLLCDNAINLDVKRIANREIDWRIIADLAASTDLVISQDATILLEAVISFDNHYPE